MLYLFTSDKNKFVKEGHEEDEPAPTSVDQHCQDKYKGAH